MAGSLQPFSFLLIYQRNTGYVYGASGHVLNGKSQPIARATCANARRRAALHFVDTESNDLRRAMGDRHNNHRSLAARRYEGHECKKQALLL